MLVAIGDTEGVVTLGLGELPETAVDAVDVRERPAGLLMEPPGERDVQRPLQLAGPLLAQAGPRAALGVQRVG